MRLLFISYLIVVVVLCRSGRALFSGGGGGRGGGGDSEADRGDSYLHRRAHFYNNSENYGDRKRIRPIKGATALEDQYGKSEKLDKSSLGSFSPPSGGGREATKGSKSSSHCVHVIFSFEHYILYVNIIFYIIYLFLINK